MTVVENIERQLEWRGPTGRSLGHVVLERADAERLLQEIYDLRRYVESIDELRRQVEAKK